MSGKVAARMTRFRQGLAVLMVALFGGGGLVGVELSEDVTPAFSAPFQGSGAMATPASDDVLEAQASERSWLDEVVFEENLGQFDPEVRFVARIAGGVAAFTDSSIRLIDLKGNEVKLDLLGNAEPIGNDPAGVVNHINGPPENWIQGAARFRQIEYPDLHEGIDVLVYGTPGGSIEFDHVVAPGADPAQARFHVQGATPVVDEGELVLGESLRLKAPYAYQEPFGERVKIAAQFKVEDGRVGYTLGDHDHERTLIIDPEVKYSSYLGQPGTELGFDVTVRNVPGSTHQVELWVVGDGQTTVAPPGFNGAVSTSGGGKDGLIAHFLYDRRSGAMAPVWFTYLGGSSTEYMQAAIAGPNGELHVTGYTLSTDFPTVNPVFRPAKGIDPEYDGGLHTNGRDVFVTTLDPQGTPTFSTYLGGQGWDEGWDVALDPSGDLVVTGSASATDRLSTEPPFPTTSGAFQEDSAGGWDVFLARVDTSTSPASLVFSTLMGGGDTDHGHAVHAGANHIHVGGLTRPPALLGEIRSFPTTVGAFATGPSGNNDAFLARFERDGTLVWSTLLGGKNQDQIHDLDVDSQGRPWVTGITYSSDLPTCPSSCAGGAPAPISTSNSGDHDAFVTQFDTAGSALLYSTYLGGSSDDMAYSIDMDPGDRPVVSGYTNSVGYPTTPDAPMPASAGNRDLFVSRIDPAAGLDFSTYYGGPEQEYTRGQDLDSEGWLYLAGWASPGMPTKNAVQPASSGTSTADYDMALVILGDLGPKAVIGISSPGHPGAQAPNATQYKVLTFEAVFFNDTLSLAGDATIDPTLNEWTLLDRSTVLSTGTGTSTPSFNGMTLIEPGMRTVCLEVEDSSPSWSYNPRDRSCVDVMWQNRPPSADFKMADTVAREVPIAFTDLSSDLDGRVVNWTWDFGDGSPPSYTSNPTHAFTSTGTYEVNLTVRDDLSHVGWTIQQITVLEGPIADFSYPPGHLLMTEPIHFIDKSSTSVGHIETWTWDFDDGSGTVVHHRAVPASFSHTFAETGTYRVSLTVQDGNSSHTVEHDVLIVAPEPLPAPDAYEALLGQDLVVQEGLLANDDHTGRWPMEVEAHTQPDHGRVVVLEDGSFTYTPPKEYVGKDGFTYHITDGHTTKGPVKVLITVRSGVPVVADFDFAVAGDTVFFQDRSRRGDVPIVEWAWRFSDGNEADTPDRLHVFPPGHHSATLRVTDAAGAESSVTKWFHIAGGSAGGGGLRVPEPVVEGPSQVEVRGTADAADRPPTAVASGPEEAAAGVEVLLDGSMSSDPEGDELHFRWRQIDGPPVVLTGTHGPRASFVPVRSGDLVFGLEVSDGHAMAVDEVTVTVVPTTLPTFAIEVLDDGTHWFNTTGTGATWSLGDGTRATGPSVAHRFAGPGQYAVRMEVGGRETVQVIRVGDGKPDLPEAEPAVGSEPGPAQAANVPEPRIPTAIATTAAGMGLLFLLVWVYRTWALVWIRVFTRVGRPEILEHPLRAQIHDAVQDQPGTLLTDLLPLLGKSRRTVAHHVRMLEGAGMLMVMRSGRYVSLHPTGSSGDGGKKAVLRSPVAQRLLEATATSPGATVSDLARHVGVAQPTVSRHVTRLESAGLVRKVKEGRTTRLFVADAKA